MPGIDTLEPDLTETSKGLDRSPNFFFEIFSIILISNYSKELDYEYYSEYNSLLLIILLSKLVRFLAFLMC